MQSKQNTFLGILITIIISAIAMLVGRYIFSEPTTSSITIFKLSVELILSIIAIYLLKPNFNIKLPKLKPAIKVFFTGFGVTILTMILLNVLEMLITGEKPTGKGHPALNRMTITQVFFFVFIGASIAEEMVFRGFLLNMISSLKKYKLHLFKKQIGLHIIISALMFGAAHLILLKNGADLTFTLRIVVLTTIVGVFAGYFQEKYNNTSYAILTHMGANLTGVIGMIVMQYADIP